MQIMSLDPLTADQASLLADKLYEKDKRNGFINKPHPLLKLVEGIETGEAWGVWDGEELIGAGGWTERGTVWAEWVDLSIGQARRAIEATRIGARVFSERVHGARLGNVMRDDDGLTRRWLGATRCFDIEEERVSPSRDHRLVPYCLRPAERLPECSRFGELEGGMPLN